MRSRKASRPATGRSVRKPRRVDQLGEQIDAEAKTTKLELQGADHPVDAIRVGERHRKDMGDIAGLAASMAEPGCCTPSSYGPTAPSSPASAGCARHSCSAGRRFPSPSSTSMTSCAASSPRTPTARTSHCPRRSPSSARWSRWRRRRRRSACSPGNPWGNSPRVMAVPSTRSPPSSASIAPPSRRPRPSSTAAEAEPERFGKLRRRHGPHRPSQRSFQAAQGHAAGRADSRRAAAAAGQGALSRSG